LMDPAEGVRAGQQETQRKRQHDYLIAGCNHPSPAMRWLPFNRSSGIDEPRSITAAGAEGSSWPDFCGGRLGGAEVARRLLGTSARDRPGPEIDWGARATAFVDVVAPLGDPAVGSRPAD
jgi:hypothetical protein